MDLSVVIPCHGQIPALAETLASLARQTLEPDRFEVIVVDNGSEESIASAIAPGNLPFATTILRQSNTGAAGARNTGAKRSQSPLLLFLDADMIADSHLLHHHLRCHQQVDHCLVAGARLSWPPARQTIFARVVELDHNFSASRPCTFQQAFSANLSINKQDFLTIGGFDEEFPLSGFEDIDLAYRCIQNGMQLVCCAEALAHHNHPLTFQEACRRTRQYHTSAALLLRKHPELAEKIAYLQDKMPISWHTDSLPLITRKIARHLLALALPTQAMEFTVNILERWWPHPALLRFLYWKVLGSYQLRGLCDGIRQYGGSWCKK